MRKLVPWAHPKAVYAMTKQAVLGLVAAGLVEAQFKTWRNGARRATWLRVLPGAFVRPPAKGTAGGCA